MTQILPKRQILIVENHPLIAESLCLMLAKIDGRLGFTVCDCAHAALLAFGAGEAYFRVYMDLDMPSAHGIFLARQFAQRGVAGRCVAISAFDNPAWHAEAVRMKLLGYLLKTSSISDLSSSLLATLNGQRVFECSPLATAAPPARLTPRQQDILCLLHRGYLSKEIATKLSLNVGTVNNHVTGLMRALNVSNRTHAIAKAMDLGYLQTRNPVRQPPQE